MEKKIVFFDIDGTLLDFNKELPESTRAAVKTLKENGVYVAIATGRAPFMIEEIRKELDIDSYVCFNGQYVVFEDEIIYRNPLSKNKLHNLLEHTKEKQVPVVLMNEYGARTTVPYSKHIEDSLRSFKLKHPEFDAEYHHHNDIFQSLLYCSEQEEKEYIQEHTDLKFIRWHPICMDVVPFGGSKAIGINEFIKRAQFQLENVYAFGDGLNDIEMLQTVGTGIAMGNAEKELLKHADVVTTAVDEDGIYNGLLKVGLI
ncbi:Cof-type HAD-IIB family hydrolase [Bacillus sp. AGMB 02131]|uniref:Cof-type HAD-IIB family hydrolase n=1 Tax=Peribacillus faecalis TaxID=2772559 RepID=A0A927CVT5_9BACI|nr:Cof-type HAD-IIB family hydrolase [Peribacillus faecalis]MBD3106885.1 Cof-type HAD-IIB family hydrolase [Peribacillus faecalis]